jgi:GTP-binding protein HflX
MTKVIGEITSLSTQTISELEALYDIKVSQKQLASIELINTMVDISSKIGREIAVFIDRKGNVQLVSVGSWAQAKMPAIWLKRGAEGFSGVRCIHTHPNGNPQLSGADLSALINFKLDAMVAIGIDEALLTRVAYLEPVEGRLKDNYLISQNITVSNLLKLDFSDLIMSQEKKLNFKGHLIKHEKEKALLVVIDWQDNLPGELNDICAELKSLAYTAGLEVLDIVVQKRDKKDPAYLIGKGKLDELALAIQEKQIDCVIFEDALTPSQQSNLMNFLGVKVLDRTSLILDIFAQRANSKEGKLQVELAQLTYLLPRLSGQGASLSRLGGGVGTRGPGETKLETDRRHIRKRIQNLKKELELVKKHRTLLQSDRKAKNLPMVALVGYTNAGKSSLLNTMAKEDVLVEDKLFATLDTTTRKVRLNSQQEILLTDTVGFIRNLPHQLIAAFKSTLTEVKIADLLLHVIDITSENLEHNIKTVQDVLKELDCSDKPVIYVFNKSDLVKNEIIIEPKYQPHCFISAKTGYGLSQLSSQIADYFSAKKVQVKIFIPYTEGHLLEKSYQTGEVEIQQYDEKGTTINLTAYESQIPNEIKKLIIME